MSVYGFECVRMCGCHGVSVGLIRYFGVSLVIVMVIVMVIVIIIVVIVLMMFFHLF